MIVSWSAHIDALASRTPFTLDAVTRVCGSTSWKKLTSWLGVSVSAFANGWLVAVASWKPAEWVVSPPPPSGRNASTRRETSDPASWLSAMVFGGRTVLPRMGVRPSHVEASPKSVVSAPRSSASAREVACPSVNPATDLPRLIPIARPALFMLRPIVSAAASASPGIAG